MVYQWRVPIVRLKPQMKNHLYHVQHQVYLIRNLFLSCTTMYYISIILEYIIIPSSPEMIHFNFSQFLRAHLQFLQHQPIFMLSCSTHAASVISSHLEVAFALPLKRRVRVM